MTLVEELEHVKAEYPQAYKYMQEIREKALAEGYHSGNVDALHADLPRFDDNDEMIGEYCCT